MAFKLIDRFRFQPRGYSAGWIRRKASLISHPPSEDCFNNPHAQCWNCKSVLKCEKDKFFCLNCAYIQPPVKCINYFQYLESPIRYDLDLALLSEKYKKLQSQLHPDKFSARSKPEQDHSADQAALINKAYQTLTGPLSRALYLLELHGRPFTETDIAGQNDFLVEMMDLNEKVMESDDLEVVKSTGDEVEKNLRLLQREFLQQFEAGKSTGNFDEAYKIASKMKYYVTVLKNVNARLGFA